ncbi:importin-11 isoform X2 [Apis laboriosa]|uniref:Importin-11 isoform X2 n=1 Tax=Apis mellifera TaxID=7460 RepID=A0A7M7LMC4_APIME|nr:importin-11 isoform X2 [Apis mellifera]XP_006613380.1 importin-11 isoform X2 [Apis dorsata]XP_012350036.1 importin-11 isoform X2 [Apis florea]XP_016904445.1 importin-11 isoform X2 [Apis cerana]XP_043787377.1 importin-11 isoform X2 [Apis laboriosa]XP_061940635.1 importin-11 isoform X2 [Apis cerana]|eukprot:XP_006559929.1 importin-11 isoform X2 [Apis mellifera]
MDAAVIEILQQAGSQDPNILKPAEQTLKQWETERGFYTALYNVFSNHSLSINIRWMAILCFKNGVDRYWRKNAPNGIADDEKEFLRQRLIANFEEPVNQIAVQLAALIAKIARYDCPREWRSLIPTLLDVIRGQNPLAQHRALLTLHHVVKSLASKRLAPDRRLFQELTINVFSFILNLWNTYTESFLIMASNGADTNQIQEALEKALLLLRILRTLIVNGFNKLSESQDAMSFLEIVFERARTCLECRKTLISRGIEMEVCDKFIIHLTKVLIGVLEMHPFCYVELIPTSLEFSVFYCFTEAGQALAFERFVIQCLNLMKGILISSYYKPAKVLEDTKDPLTLRANQLRQEFFTPETLTEICSRLVTHYFLLTPAELELWDTDPENFVVDDGGESWKYSLRPCTECLFVAIFHQFGEVLVPILVELMQRHHQPVDPNNLHAILVKDAVYNAVGLAAFDLYDEVNFDQWFSTTLKEELKIRSNNYRIIRRRVCWLIGRWTTVKLSAELRPELYELMVEVLSPEEDLGVRLAASDALKLAIDDFQFNPEEFSPYLEPAFSLLLSLLKEVKECDTKMHVLYVLSFMIERAGSEINPHVGTLSSYLPALWQHSEEYNMLRCAIISTLVHLEKALGPESIVIEPLVVAVIALSCDVNQDCHVYLLEDGLRLWLALLENAPAPTPAIMELAKNLPAVLEQSFEHLKLCLYIVQAYVILSPQEFLSQRGAVIIETLRSILGDLNPEGAVMTMTVFELCLCASPRQGAELIKPVLITIFENMYREEEVMMTMTMYLSIVARVLWFYKDIFIQVISELTRKMGRNEAREDAVLGEIIHIWVNRMPYISQLERRKLLALALCSLLGANSPPSVFQHFPLIISNIVGTLNDITKFDDVRCEHIGCAIDGQSSPSQYEDEEYGNKHEQRKRRLDFSDPLSSISLKDTLQNQLLTLRRLIGDNQFNQLMLTLHPEIDKELKLYVSL